MSIKSMCVKMKESVKQFCKENPKALMRSSACSIGAVIASGASLTCFAADGTPLDLSTVLSTSLNSLTTQFNTYAGVVVPVALGIFGTVFGIQYGMKLFKKASK